MENQAPKLQQLPQETGTPHGNRLKDCCRGCWRGAFRCSKTFITVVYRFLKTNIFIVGVAILAVYTLLGGLMFSHIEEIQSIPVRLVNPLNEMRSQLLQDILQAIPDHKNVDKNKIEETIKKYEDDIVFKITGRRLGDATERKHWPFRESVFFCFTAITTIGYGHIYPVTDKGKILFIIYSAVGIPICLAVMVELAKAMTQAMKLFVVGVRFLYHCSCWKRTPHTEIDVESAGLRRRQHTVEAHAIDDTSSVSLGLAVIASIAYISIGAIIYVKSEEWTYLDSIYFTFVSVSTIGLGDLIPKHSKIFLESCLYILVGLALIAMTANLAMEKIDEQMQHVAENTEWVILRIGNNTGNVAYKMYKVTKGAGRLAAAARKYAVAKRRKQQLTSSDQLTDDAT